MAATRARFQRQRGVQLHPGKAGDDDLPVRLAKHGRNSLAAAFWVIKLNERAGVEVVVRRFQNRSSRSAMIASDQELASLAVILRTSS
jgi:hypothetical protein